MNTAAPNNRTLTCRPDEYSYYVNRIVTPESLQSNAAVHNSVINADFFSVASHLPCNCADLLILDPPYNLRKSYNGNLFKKSDTKSYSEWFDRILVSALPLLKQNGTVYVCADWRTSTVIVPVLERHLVVRNRITWEREKGRGSKKNWKNNSEDIWFCTKGNDYYFDVESIKQKRRVIAPYRENGKPKDWFSESSGNFRLTHPSNIWTDITIPFWSMPENTNHPTQKSEKLMAKLILASSRPNDLILDPFLGSGTSAVSAKKLGRQYCGIEISEEYCVWSLKRLHYAEYDKSIQGYKNGVFWDRNTLTEQKKEAESSEGTGYDKREDPEFLL